MMPDEWRELAKDYLANRVSVTDAGCWITPIRVDAEGYARSVFRRKKYFIHRLAYEAYVGAIPAGLQLDHLCRVRACCNPQHLEAVTNWENTRRSTNPMALKAAQTHCKRGHAFTPENTRRRGTARECKTCKRMLAKARRLRP